jgi:hypothetical protein
MIEKTPKKVPDEEAGSVTAYNERRQGIPPGTEMERVAKASRTHPSHKEKSP